VVLRGAQEHLDPSALRASCTWRKRPRRSATRPSSSSGWWRRARSSNPILAIALGHADEVVVRVPVAAGAPADGKSLQSLCMETETGFYLLAIRRGGRYLYRPAPAWSSKPADDLIATGPDEGPRPAAELCG